MKVCVEWHLWQLWANHSRLPDHSADSVPRQTSRVSFTPLLHDSGQVLNYLVKPSSWHYRMNTGKCPAFIGDGPSLFSLCGSKELWDAIHQNNSLLRLEVELRGEGSLRQVWCWIQIFTTLLREIALQSTASLPQRSFGVSLPESLHCLG